MGATQFIIEAEGSDVWEAFFNARQKDPDGPLHHKTAPCMVTQITVCPDLAEEYIMPLLNDPDHFTYDKWGMAGCVKTGETSWTFFGWSPD